MSTREHVDQLTTAARGKAFLGPEFLTWLWYVAETGRERQTLPASESNGAITGRSVDYDFWVDDRLVLESRSATQHSSVMKGGDPSQSQEAAVALAAGKTVRELKLGLNVQSVGEYSAILAGEDLAPRSLKLPSAPGESGDGKAAAGPLPLASRIKHLDLFLAIIDQLFRRFLAARTEADWDDEVVPAMRSWIKKRQTPTAAGRRGAKDDDGDDLH
jgi:hypothetical protein